MQVNIDLKQITKKVYMSYFQDGLWDILLGIYILCWGFSIWKDLVAVMGGLWICIYFLVLGLKRVLVYPRAGYIKLGEARKQQMKMVILGAVLFLLGLVALTAFAMYSRPQWLDDYFMFMLITMMAAVIAVLGYWWRVSRWYIYAAITFLGASAQQWIGLPIELAFFIPGGVMGLYGIWMLIKFLRKYPKPTPEERDVVS